MITWKSGTERLRESISLAVGYLCNRCDRDGRFVYRVNMNPRIRVSRKYNELRHAGTIYALAAYKKETDSDPEVTAALTRSVRFLRRRCLDKVPGHDGVLAIWSRRKLTGESVPDQVKLGGVGLGLVGFLSAAPYVDSGPPLEELRGLGNFLVRAQKPDGSFYSKFVPSCGGFDDSWVSLYYPGESALGLLMLYEVDPDPTWLETAASSLGYLARSREGKTSLPADHWALIATEKLLPLYHLCDAPVSREQLIQHAMKVSESILRSQIKAGDPAYVGSFSKTGDTAPTATRLEGLLAALAYLPDDALDRVTNAINAGMKFLLNAQVQDGRYAGAFPGAVAPTITIGKTSRSVARRITEVRIDYVQHALNAMIHYARILGG